MEGELTVAYPLQWPAGRPRTTRRQSSRFASSFTDSRSLLLEELKRLGAANVVISSNIQTRLDGLPYANTRRPEDPAVAVYFTWNGQQYCFACDKWDMPKDNLRAIAKTVEALRGINRWGTGEMMQAAFTGFQSLPAPASREQSCWDVLGLAPGSSGETVRMRYRELARRCHPDSPTGSTEAMAELNQAYETALAAARNNRGGNV